MSRLQLFLYLLSILILIFFHSCSPKKDTSSNKIDFLSIAINAEKYIQTAKYQSTGGATWKVMPDSLESKGSTDLYSGTPGVVLFYLELYHTTNDISFLNEAKSGADYLINAIPDTITNEVGLYTGLAGIGFTLIEVYKALDGNLPLHIPDIWTTSLTAPLG